jgi:hypothetical protein
LLEFGQLAGLAADRVLAVTAARLSQTSSCQSCACAPRVAGSWP